MLIPLFNDSEFTIRQLWATCSACSRIYKLNEEVHKQIGTKVYHQIPMEFFERIEMSELVGYKAKYVVYPYPLV